MARRTPGPWFNAGRVEGDSDSRDYYAIDSESAGTVAEVCQKGDADLIAAAPDLLAACRDAYDYCQGMLASQRSGIDDSIIRAHLKEKCRAAFRKATGEDRP